MVKANGTGGDSAREPPRVVNNKEFSTSPPLRLPQGDEDAGSPEVEVKVKKGLKPDPSYAILENIP